MVNLIAVAVIAVIVGAAAGYVYKEKKRGAKCIGCSAAGACAHANAGGCTCGTGSCHAESL